MMNETRRTPLQADLVVGRGGGKGRTPPIRLIIFFFGGGGAVARLARLDEFLTHVLFHIV